jgi:hypothetical protein
MNKKVSFKQFSSFVDLPGEVSEEQLTEIFGIFTNNKKADELQAQRAKLKADEFNKRKAIAAKKTEIWQKRAAELKNNGGYSNAEKGAVSGRSAQAMGRAAENDWVRGLANEAIKPKRTSLKL